MSWAIVAAFALAAAVGIGLSAEWTTAGDAAPMTSPVGIKAAEDTLPTSIQLAQDFTARLNEHDVDSMIDLMTDEDAGPTVIADRYAWQKYEIRKWAEQQVGANIRVDAHDYRPSEHGATWEADVYRDDWAARGVAPLALTNSIWVHNGKLAVLTSHPRQPSDVERLGDLWRPASTPPAPSLASSQVAPGTQPSGETDALAVAERFLEAREAGDFQLASAWCAPVLELQDVDGSWFVDRATMSDWLIQLTDAYAVDAIRPLSVSNNAVGWTERLTRRDGAPEVLPARLTLAVHAVVRNGMIDYMSAPYPAFPLRRAGAASRPVAPSEPAGAPPMTMFLGSAVSLSVAAVLMARGGPVLLAALGRWR